MTSKPSLTILLGIPVLLGVSSFVEIKVGYSLAGITYRFPSSDQENSSCPEDEP